MTDTIPNVPRELTIERDVFGAMHIKLGDFDFIQIQYQYPYTDNASTKALAERIAALLSAPSPAGVDGLELKRYWHNPKLGFCELDPKYFDDEPGYVAYGDAQAIIDGLRSDLAVALKVPSVAAMRAYLDTECAKDNMRLGTERDKQAQRIGELEGLLRSCLPALSDGGCAALANRIDAALSAGKEVE